MSRHPDARAAADAPQAALELAQERLRASEALYRHVVELSNLIPWTADAQGEILSVGELWTEWTGATLDAALAQGWHRFLHPDDVRRAADEWNRAVTSGTHFDTEFRVHMRDGSFRWCRSRATKRMDADGDPIAWYGTAEDIHDQRLAAEAFQRTQAELARVSRLSAMGAMASAIAHDLNQPLTAIAHYLRGSRRLLDWVEGEGKLPLAEALEDADKSVVRASDIVRRVREFVTRGTVDARRENMEALIEHSCHFALNDRAARDVICRTEYAVHCDVFADRVQIQQVLVNLIQNAIEAMQDRPEPRLTIRTLAGRPGYCQVAIEDNGPGIPPDAGGRIFDPLFTTRRNGMGVGLAICRMIIEAHGGAIWHEPAPGGGTIINFTLPLAD